MAHMTPCRRFLVSFVLTIVLPGVSPASVASQSDAEHRARIDGLLSEREVEGVLASLGNDFFGQFLMLVPDLSPEDQDILRNAIETAFATETVQASVAGTLAAEMTPSDVEVLWAARQSGPLEALMEGLDGYEPSVSLEEFKAEAASLDRDRLQLMVALVEAKGSSDLAVSVDEALRYAAHRLLTTLGGNQTFTPMTDQQFDAAYRSRTLSLALESMYRMGGVSDDVVLAALDAHGSGEARTFSERTVDALVDAIQVAGDGVGALVVPTESPTESQPEPEAAEPADPASAPPCRVLTCGFVVEWDGREPIGNSMAYGATGDLEEFTFRALVGAGYNLARATVDDGFTIVLRPRPQRIRCEIVSGTDPRTCLAVGDVRIRFQGSYPGFDGETTFTVRNRCRANEVMSAPGIANLVAARIHHELTTFEGDDRREPRC